MMTRHVKLAILAMVVLLASPRPAAAYLDPVTGSIAFQVLMGSLLTALAALRLYWRRIKGLFRRTERDAPNT